MVNVIELLAKCNTAAEFRLCCTAEGIDADKAVKSVMSTYFTLFDGLLFPEVEKESVFAKITVEILYEFRPKIYIVEPYQLGKTYFILENDVIYRMIKNAVNYIS